MVKTIPADLSFMFIVGMVFSWQTAQQIPKSKYLFFNKYFGTLLLFQTIFLMPQAILYYLWHADWCWMYWLDSKKIPLGFVMFAYFFYYPAMILGYLLGFYLEKKKTNLSFSAIKISLLFLLIFACLTFKRLFYVGTLKEFYQGNASAIIFQPLLFITVFGGIVLSILVLIYILHSFGKELDFNYKLTEGESFFKVKPVVALHKVTNDLKQTLKNSLLLWNSLENLQQLLEKKNKKVIIKPNLAGGGKDRKGTQTSVEILSAVIDLLREIKPEAEIFIVESGSIFWWNIDLLLKNSAYEKLFLEKKVKFINLSQTKTKKYDFGGRIGKDEIPEILLKPHLLIDIPVAKTHAYFKMSGAIKNLFGLMPEGFKLFRYHAAKGIDNEGRIFLDIYRNFPPDLVIVDGIISCEGTGPLGTPKETNFIITSNDAVSVDFVLSEIMGFEKKEIPYLKVLLEEGYSLDFNLLGDNLENVKPENWKHTTKFWGLNINFYKILWEHLKPIIYKKIS